MPLNLPHPQVGWCSLLRVLGSSGLVLLMLQHHTTDMSVLVSFQRIGTFDLSLMPGACPVASTAKELRSQLTMEPRRQRWHGHWRGRWHGQGTWWSQGRLRGFCQGCIPGALAVHQGGRPQLHGALMLPNPQPPCRTNRDTRSEEQQKSCNPESEARSLVDTAPNGDGSGGKQASLY